MNLAVLQTSRRAPRVGDVFAMMPPDREYLFGRVISTEAAPLGLGGANLIYIYRIRSTEKVAPVDLDCGGLLIPPAMVNRLPWSRGYCEFLENRALTDSDCLNQHCFKDSRGRYFDELGNRLAAPVEPVGQFGLESFRSIDDSVSNALGLPLSPE